MDSAVDVKSRKERTLIDAAVSVQRQAAPEDSSWCFRCENRDVVILKRLDWVPSMMYLSSMMPARIVESLEEGERPNVQTHPRVLVTEWIRLDDVVGIPHQTKRRGPVSRVERGSFQAVDIFLVWCVLRGRVSK